MNYQYPGGFDVLMLTQLLADIYYLNNLEESFRIIF